MKSRRKNLNLFLADRPATACKALDIDHEASANGILASQQVSYGR
jgi:hypothetical protein